MIRAIFSKLYYFYWEKLGFNFATKIIDHRQIFNIQTSL